MRLFLTGLVAAMATLFSITVCAQSKKGSIKGIIVDAVTKQPVDYVSYAVKNVNDSTVASMGVTNKDGIFSLKNLNLGQYKFYAALMGYKPVIRAFEITNEKNEIDFGNLQIEESAININDVLIKGDLLPMLIKKDTIEFSPEAFKTQADANVEDVLKLMPGMEVDRDGTITFNGKKIDRVLVDGKEFFGTDVKMATQNLPKDIISKIQVIEKKTDDAIFKGVDNGKRENVMNFTLKEDKKKGYFGNATLGKADGNLYEANININRFSGKKQFSVFGLSNNINKSGFGEFAAPMIVSSGVFIGSQGGGGGGISRTRNAGANYNNEWGKFAKFQNKIYLNYSFNGSNSVNQNISSRLNLLGADSYFLDRNTNNTNTVQRHTFNGRMEFTLDTTLRLQIRPNINFSQNSQVNLATYNSYRQNTLANINNGNSTNSSDAKTPYINGTITLNKRLKKKGRTYSVYATGNTSNQSSDGLMSSVTVINNNGAPTTDILNQLSDQDTHGAYYELGANYNEPITKNLELNTYYEHSKREDLVTRAIYDYNTATTRYDLYNTSLSRNLENYNTSNDVGFDINYNLEDKFNFSIETRQEFVRLTGLNTISNQFTERNFSLFQPSVYLSYKVNKTTRLSINIYRNTNTPSLQQLQPLVDNSNPLQIFTGNPLLKPSKYNSFSFSFDRFELASGASYYANFNAGSQQDQIMNNTQYDPLTGIQNTIYDNVNGNYNFSFRLGGNVKSKKLGIAIGPFAGMNVGKTYSFFNSALVNSNFRIFNYGLGLTYNVGTSLQFYNRFNSSLRRISYNYNNLPVNTFINSSNNLNLTVSLPYELRFTLQSYLTFNSNAGIPGNNEPLNTVAINMEKLFLNKALSLKGTISDVFNNSKNSTRQAYDTYILENVNIGLRRYFLLSMTYKLKKFGT